MWDKSATLWSPPSALSRIRSKKTMRDRVERLLTGDLVNLTLLEVTDTIEAENVCSVAGKEN